MPEGSPVPKKSIHKKWWLWALIVFVLYSIGSSGGKTEKDSAGSPTGGTTTLPSVVTAPSEQPPTVLTMTDRLWAALDTSVHKRAGYDLELDEKTGIVTLTEMPKTVWDENALVRRSYANLVAYGMEVFKLEGVKGVQSIVVGSFTDAYGKKANEDAVRLTMSEEEFAKYDWSNLYYKPVWQQMKQSSIDYYIHPTLVKNVEFDKLYLVKP